MIRMNLGNKPGVLQAILDKTVDNRTVFGSSFAIKKDDLTWCGASGNMAKDQPYFIASTTKLFTTALILHLKSRGQLALEDPIGKYLDASITNGLHIYHGKDYSASISIKNLLAHTSGLPNYFLGKGANGKRLERELTSGLDQSWTFEHAIETAKAMKSHFVPDTKNKACYSDTNFQLLGKIIETITHTSYSANCKELIIQPLKLANTYVYEDSADRSPMPLYYKTHQLQVPN